jgi:hypothetical protein
MIKFFRKIRQGLLKENKFSKYLLYAIGEIILVVIGILIALQLNNLNDQKKINMQEKKLLAELVNNLDENIGVIENFITTQNATVHFADSILNHFKNNTATDSLAKIFKPIILNYNISLSFSTFETIKTIGFDLIKNDQIRRDIIELYEVDYPAIIFSLQNIGMATFQSYSDWFYNNGHLRDRILNSTLYRNDSNFHFIENYIYVRRNYKSDMLRNMNHRAEKTKALKQLILDYLEESK